jgi:tripartite motif-containing protein 71
MSPRRILFVAAIALAGCGVHPTAPTIPSLAAKPESSTDQLNRTELFAPPQFLWARGGLGTAIGQFDSPQAVATDQNGNVYVADTANNRIQKFTKSGAFVLAWGSHGTGSDAPGGEFYYPRGIAVDARGDVLVADSNNQRVQVFSSDGTFLMKWVGQFINPRCIAVDGRGHVYINDEGVYRVEKYTEDGTFLLSWGSQGSSPGMFELHRGIAVSASGHVYVTDWTTRWIQEFSASGILIRAWGGPNFYGADWVSEPAGVATDPEGRVYVVDKGFGDIKVFSSTGEFLLRWGVGGTDVGQFDQPEGIAIDSRGFIYVTDIVNHRVQAFTPLRRGAISAAAVQADLRGPS